VSDRDARLPTDDRRVRGRDRGRRARWSIRVLLYGGGQVALFAIPILWLVYRGTRYMVLTRTGASVALIGVPVLVGTLRAFGPGPGFPRLDTAMLATYYGNRAYLRRAALVNTVFVVAAYGGAGIGAVAAVATGVPTDAPGVVAGVALVAAAFVTGLVGSFGALGGSSRAVRARMSVHAAGLGLVLWIAVPTETALGVAAVVAYGALTVADVALGIRAHGL